MSEAARRDMEDEWLAGQMVERWVVWRDASDWERFGTVLRDPGTASD